MHLRYTWSWNSSLTLYHLYCFHNFHRSISWTWRPYCIAGEAGGTCQGIAFPWNHTESWQHARFRTTAATTETSTTTTTTTKTTTTTTTISLFSPTYSCTIYNRVRFTVNNEKHLPYKVHLIILKTFSPLLSGFFLYMISSELLKNLPPPGRCRPSSFSRGPRLGCFIQ